MFSIEAGVKLRHTRGLPIIRCPPRPPFPRASHPPPSSRPSVRCPDCLLCNHELTLPTPHDLFPNQHDAGCGAGPEIANSSCDAILSHQCAGSSAEESAAAPPLYREQVLYYGLTKGNLAAPTVAARLPDLAQDLANFL